jgi:hypothetical protein
VSDAADVFLRLHAARRLGRRVGAADAFGFTSARKCATMAFGCSTSSVSSRAMSRVQARCTNPVLRGLRYVGVWKLP